MQAAPREQNQSNLDVYFMCQNNVLRRKKGNLPTQGGKKRI